jgi:serine/threonine protein kinase
VIHRDLKPGNIMVGGFGEVQVMDWGVAKVLARGGEADEELLPTVSESAESTIRTVRSGSDADASQAGIVLGTPSYMAPEQARGEVDAVDERADVFGLGSMLCEILTGRPVFTGRPSRSSAMRPPATWRMRTGGSTPARPTGSWLAWRGGAWRPTRRIDPAPPATWRGS